MRVIAVVQARIGSARLPGKILEPLCPGRCRLNNCSVLAHVLERMLHIPGLTHFVVTSPPSDVGLLRDLHFLDGLDWFPHEPPDVLKGFWAAAATLKADVIVRLTGDNPLLDPNLSGLVLSLYQLQAASSDRIYAHNLNPPTRWPEGLDTEVFPARLLWDAPLRDGGNDREHVTAGIARVAQHAVLHAPNPPALVNSGRWTVDTQEDLDRVRAIYAHLPPGDFSWQATLRAAREAGV